jgi:hypothetical protein
MQRPRGVCSGHFRKDRTTRHTSKWGYDIYLTAVGLPPGGSTTVHIYTQTIHRTTHNKQYIEQHKFRKSAVHAPYWLVIPWHLPYNWGKSTENLIQISSVAIIYRTQNLIQISSVASIYRTQNLIPISSVAIIYRTQNLVIVVALSPFITWRFEDEAGPCFRLLRPWLISRHMRRVVW